MGHGCNSSCSNYFEKQIPDTGVKYTGPAIPALGICTGDYLSEVDAVILQKLVDYSTGVGISIPSIDLTQGACAVLFADCIGCCNSCTDLPCLLACYKTAICTLYTDVTTIQAEIGPLLSGYATGCLPGVDNTSLVSQVIQVLINQYCILNAQVQALQITVDNLSSGLGNTIGNFLLGHITTCSGTQNVIKTGAGSTASIQFQGFVPVGAVIPYAGNLSNFSGGVGIPGTPMCGWNVANGQNLTVNMMGQVPVGLTNMDGTLPSNAIGLSVVTVGAIIPGSEATHILTGPESGTASHTHTVNDPGHSHVISVNLDSASGANNANYMKFDATSYTNTLDGQPDSGNIHAKIRTNYTGISINPSGAVNAVSAHNNMQPSTGLLYIQRMF